MIWNNIITKIGLPILNEYIALTMTDHQMHIYKYFQLHIYISPTCPSCDHRYGV